MLEASTLKNLRLALGFSAQEIALKAGLTPHELRAFESAARPPTYALLSAYSDALRIRRKLLILLFIGPARRVVGFDYIRSYALKILNGYLRLGLWMTALDETQAISR